MNTLRLPRLLALGFVLAGAFVAVPGCSSTPDARETVDSMSNFGLEVAKVKDSIDNSLKALDTVTRSQPAEINANVGAYTQTVAALEKQAQVIKSRADEMKSMGDEFFKEKESTANMTPERRAELSASFARIKADMASAKEAFVPFLASMKDIDSYLKVDSTTKGISSMGELAKKAKDHGAHVKSLIDGVLAQTNAVRGMLATD